MVGQGLTKNVDTIGSKPFQSLANKKLGAFRRINSRLDHNRTPATLVDGLCNFGGSFRDRVGDVIDDDRGTIATECESNPCSNSILAARAGHNSNFASKGKSICRHDDG